MTVFGTVFEKKKVELPGLELMAGEVFRSCQSWTLYHCATKLRQFLLLKFFIKNVSTGKTVVYTIVTVFFTLILLLSFSLSQHCCDIRYFRHSSINPNLYLDYGNVIHFAGTALASEMSPGTDSPFCPILW